MVLATVCVCRVSLDTVQRRAVSKREEEKTSIFEEERSVKKRVLLKSHGHAEASLHTASLASVPLLGQHKPKWDYGKSLHLIH